MSTCLSAVGVLTERAGMPLARIVGLQVSLSSIFRDASILSRPYSSSIAGLSEHVDAKHKMSTSVSISRTSAIKMTCQIPIPISSRHSGHHEQMSPHQATDTTDYVGAGGARQCSLVVKHLSWERRGGKPRRSRIPSSQHTEGLHMAHTNTYRAVYTLGGTMVKSFKAI